MICLRMHRWQVVGLELKPRQLLLLYLLILSFYFYFILLYFSSSNSLSWMLGSFICNIYCLLIKAFKVIKWVMTKSIGSDTKNQFLILWIIIFIFNFIDLCSLLFLSFCFRLNWYFSNFSRWKLIYFIEAFLIFFLT